MMPTGRAIEQPAATEKCCFDPGRNRYALRLVSGRMIVRRVSDDQEVACFEAGAGSDVPVFLFSPDGRYLATSRFPGYGLTVWDVDRDTIALAEPGPVGGTAVRFSPDSRRIALARRDGEILIYDLETRRPRRLGADLGILRDLAFRPDGLQLAVTTRGTAPPKCHILRVDSAQVIRTIPLRSISSVAWSPDGATLAMGGDDFKIDLWDARSGIPTARLEGSTNRGLHATFHPAGTLLASACWDGRLRLWDAVLGRAVLSVVGSDPAGHSSLVLGPNGQIVLQSEGRLTTYEVDPVLEYRSFAHVSGEPMHYQRPSIRRDNRLLAVGSEEGVTLWDLARGTECAFLPIGRAWHVMFESNGDLLTSGPTGLRRWPFRLDAERGEFRIGPPSDLPFSKKSGQFDEDRTGRIIAAARNTHAEVRISGRSTQIKPLDECRYVAVSPDGEWLATGSHHRAPRSGALAMPRSRWPSFPWIGAPPSSSARTGSGC